MRYPASRRHFYTRQIRLFRPSETHVKRGDRVVGGSKELIEKLGRNDPKPVRIGLVDDNYLDRVTTTILAG
jgi:hypothetical protein